MKLWVIESIRGKRHSPVETDMPSVSIYLDETTYQALNRIAPARQRRRTAFIREAVRVAIRSHEYTRMREAYRRQPDTTADADCWSSCEEFTV